MMGSTAAFTAAALLVWLSAAVAGHDWFGEVPPGLEWNLLRKDQGDNVFHFNPEPDAESFLRVLVRDEHSLLVGGRNMLYNLSAFDLAENVNERIIWYPEEKDKELCIVKGKTEADCANYIRVFARIHPSSVGGGGDFFLERYLVCGTNAFNPKCRHYARDPLTNDWTVEKEFSGKGFCPYDPRHNSTAIYTDGKLYSGTVADFSGTDPLIIRDRLRTEQYDLKHLNAPNFVGSLEDPDYVYFFFRETAVEYINCGKSVYSRVARVCKRDNGGPHKFHNKWTTFLKARLNCSVPGDMPFYFNEIQSVHVDEATRGVYAVFTTPENALAGSAICYFNAEDIAATFAFSAFKSQATVNANWLPMAKAQTPSPRPGMCPSHAASRGRAVGNKTSESEVALNFIRRHALLDEAVPSAREQPLFVRASLGERMTAVLVARYPNANYATKLILAGTSAGKVLKLLLRPGDASAVLVETLQVLPLDHAIRSLGLGVKGDLEADQVVSAVSDSSAVSVPLERCSALGSSCERCLSRGELLPCVWRQDQGRCTQMARQHRSNGYRASILEHADQCPQREEARSAPELATTQTATTTTTTPTTTTTRRVIEVRDSVTRSNSSVPLFTGSLFNTSLLPVLNIRDYESTTCPSCTCDCPSEPPVTQSSALENSAVDSVIAGAQQPLEEEPRSQSLLRRQQKDLDVFLELLNSREEIPQGGNSLEEKRLPKRESILSPGDFVSSTVPSETEPRSGIDRPSLTASFSEQTIVLTAIVSSVVSLAIGFAIGLLVAKLGCKMLYIPDKDCSEASSASTTTVNLQPQKSDPHVASQARKSERIQQEASMIQRVLVSSEVSSTPSASADDDDDDEGGFTSLPPLTEHTKKASGFVRKNVFTGLNKNNFKEDVIDRSVSYPRRHSLAEPSVHGCGSVAVPAVQVARPTTAMGAPLGRNHCKSSLQQKVKRVYI